MRTYVHTQRSDNTPKVGDLTTGDSLDGSSSVRPDSECLLFWDRRLRRGNRRRMKSRQARTEEKERTVEETGASAAFKHLQPLEANRRTKAILC